jgi:hypothetical protein
MQFPSIYLLLPTFSDLDVQTLTDYEHARLVNVYYHANPDISVFDHRDSVSSHAEGVRHSLDTPMGRENGESIWISCTWS